MSKQVILRMGKTPELFIGNSDEGEVIPLTYTQVWRLAKDGLDMLDVPWMEDPHEPA